MPDYQGSGPFLTETILADCEINGSAGAGAAFQRNFGFASFVRNGAGDYSLTLNFATDVASDGYSSYVLDVGATALVLQRVSPTVIRVRTFTDPAALVDVDFGLRVHRFGQGR